MISCEAVLGFLVVIRVRVRALYIRTPYGRTLREDVASKIADTRLMWSPCRYNKKTPCSPYNMNDDCELVPFVTSSVSTCAIEGSISMFFFRFSDPPNLSSRC